jgi:hypothetical protein
MTNHISCQHQKLKKFRLSEIFSRLLAKGGPYEKKQKRLGLEIGLSDASAQSTVSQIKNNSPQWEEHWRAFWLILDICEKYSIDPAKPLQASKRNPTDLEVLDEAGRILKAIDGDGPSEKSAVKETFPRTVSPGGASRDKRKRPAR